MKNDITDITLGAESLQAIRAAITTLTTEFAGFTVTLDEAQRKHSQHMGQRNETFSRDIIDLAKERPQLVPLSFEVTGLDRDLTAREQLAPLVSQMQTLTRLLEDTHAALGIDLYNGARAIYSALKIGAKINGIADVLARIGARFAGQGRRKTNPDSSPSTPTVTSNTK